MLRAEVIEGRAARLLTVVHPAAGGVECGAVIVVPPFAEEMNKARRMITLFAQGAAARGITTVVPDLTGTGDSDGEFSDARWDIWCDDLARLSKIVETRTGHPPTWLAVRSGALLAFAVAQSGAARSARLILWAPVLDGERFMRQFLRLKVAGAMTQAAANPADRASVANLEASLRAGNTLEVAGYAIAPELWAAMITTKLPAAPPISVADVHWFEVSEADPREFSPAVQRSIEQLNGNGWRVQAQTVAGPAFWGTAEISTAPELIAKSVAALESAA
jgi:exosortase A-associated hydrolase 2